MGNWSRWEGSREPPPPPPPPILGLENAMQTHGIVACLKERAAIVKCVRPNYAAGPHADVTGMQTTIPGKAATGRTDMDTCRLIFQERPQETRHIQETPGTIQGREHPCQVDMDRQKR